MTRDLMHVQQTSEVRYKCPKAAVFGSVKEAPVAGHPGEKRGRDFSRFLGEEKTGRIVTVDGETMAEW